MSESVNHHLTWNLIWWNFHLRVTKLVEKYIFLAKYLLNLTPKKRILLNFPMTEPNLFIPRQNNYTSKWSNMNLMLWCFSEKKLLVQFKFNTIIISFIPTGRIELLNLTFFSIYVVSCYSPKPLHLENQNFLSTSFKSSRQTLLASIVIAKQ